MATAVMSWEDETRAAIQQSELHANDACKVLVLEEIKKIAEEKEEFIANDIFLRAKDLTVSTHDFRAIGPVIAKAKRMGLIMETGKYAKNPNRHGSPCPIWTKSLIIQ